MYSARCLVVKRKLAQEFAQRPPVRGEECRWRKIGVYETCKKIATRYKIPVWRVIEQCNPYNNPAIQSTTN